jgi:predicted GNAT family N-acyltransferase
MKADDYNVEITDWEASEKEIKSVRQSVFIEEQHVPVELEWDGLDPDCTHFIVRSGTQAIATARIKPDGHIGRMAVLKPHRNLGVGRLLLTAVLSFAEKIGLGDVYLHAQVQVVGFYHKSGFNTEGEIFMDAGIPHRAMRKKTC